MKEQVEARAFRGTRKKSVYRSHPLPADSVARIASAGRGSGLALVASLDSADVQVQKEDARRLADELSELRLGVQLLDLDEDIVVLAELARFCARSRRGSWLTLTLNRN